jgi:hypothetical protein
LKVYLGPYYNWFQPGKWYKDLMLWAAGFGRNADYEKINIDEHDRVRSKIQNSWIHGKLVAVERWFDARTARKIKIEIHPYDVWGMDHTLALIVVPMLKLLKEKKMGSAYVADEDVPEELKSTSAPPLTDVQKTTGESDANLHKRWEWALSEMLWAMEQVADEESDSKFFEHPSDPRLSFEESVKKMKFDKDGYAKWQARKQHGLMLFGKYFEALWD